MAKYASSKYAIIVGLETMQRHAVEVGSSSNRHFTCFLGPGPWLYIGLLW